MKEIKLTQGKLARVDDLDFDWLNQWPWHAVKVGGGKWYANRNSKPDPITGKRRGIRMHQQILGFPKELPDHRDGDGLNNQRENLRLTDFLGNAQNAVRRKDNRSGFKGVGFHKASNMWRARIRVNGKLIQIGSFKSPTEAALAYDAAAEKYFGEFAVLNFPNNTEHKPSKIESTNICPK